MSRIYQSALEAFGAEAAKGFQLQVHPQAARWTPSRAVLSQISRRFADPTMKITLWPRHMVPKVFERPASPYAFRAFTRGGQSHLFVDRSETPASIAWLMSHELSHQMLARRPEVLALLDEAEPRNIDHAGDTFHFVDPEERLCDGIATNLVGERLDRKWWRGRLHGMSRT